MLVTFTLPLLLKYHNTLLNSTHLHSTFINNEAIKNVVWTDFQIFGSFKNFIQVHVDVK